jgi:hypothetical protein
MLLHDWLKHWPKNILFRTEIIFRSGSKDFALVHHTCSSTNKSRSVSFPRWVFLKISGKLFLSRTGNPKIDTNLPIQKIWFPESKDLMMNRRFRGSAFKLSLKQIKNQKPKTGDQSSQTPESKSPETLIGSGLRYSPSHVGWYFWKLFQSSKLKAQSWNGSFHWIVAKEMFELWALSFETAFENVTPSGIGCMDESQNVYLFVCLFGRDEFDLSLSFFLSWGSKTQPGGERPISNLRPKNLSRTRGQEHYLVYGRPKEIPD